MIVVHAGLSAASDCAMVSKVRVTNGIEELRSEEDTLTTTLLNLSLAVVIY